MKSLNVLVLLTAVAALSAVKKRHNQNFNRGPQQQKECLHRIQPRGLKFQFPSHHLQIPIHVHNRCYVGQ